MYVYREFHPNDKRYTWENTNTSETSTSRLFSCFSLLVEQVKNSDIMTSSDHSPVPISLKFNDFKHGSGL